MVGSPALGSAPRGLDALVHATSGEPISYSLEASHGVTGGGAGAATAAAADADAEGDGPAASASKRLKTGDA